MDRLIYTALSGMTAQARRQAVTANNLANAQVPGFRREVVAAEGRYLDGAHHPARAQAGSPSLTTPREAGQVRATGRPLDIALEGDAWLAIQGPLLGGQPSEAYTRRGDLALTSTGLLVGGDGRAVLNGAGVPITVPAGAALEIGADGSLVARTADGPQALGRLKLVAGAQLNGLSKNADGLFVSPAPLPADPAARLQAGALEGANISPTAALVELVEEQRGFEVNARLLRIAREMDEQGARLMSMDN